MHSIEAHLSRLKTFSSLLSANEYNLECCFSTRRELSVLVTILDLVLSLSAFVELFHAKVECVLRTGVSGDEQGHCHEH
jgi:hypothetical protein